MSPLNFTATIMLFHKMIYAGITMVVMPLADVRSIDRIVSVINRYKVNVGFFPPSLLRLLKIKPGGLKKIITGGEHSNNLYLEGVDISCIYAQSESGFDILTFFLDKEYEKAPAGKAMIPEMDVCLQDENGNSVEQGEVGEICYRQPYFRGYLNLSEKNETLFRNGYVRSGDIAKVLPDGNFMILGRNDDMVKLNGNRVEPAEIEIVVKKILQTEWVGVRIFTEEKRNFVCAYYIGEPVISIEEARKIIGEKLVYYMQPAFYIRIDQIPLSANGKFKRNDLPAPDFNYYLKDYVAPSNELEGKLCNVMASVLGLERVGVTDDFYEIGGDSINAIKVITRLNMNGLDVNMLLMGRTPREINRLYEKEIANGLVDINELNERLLAEPQPLSIQFQYIYEIHQRFPDSLLLNLPILLKFDEGTDFGRLKNAVDTVLAAHPAFSCIFSKADDGTFVRKYNANIRFDTKIEEITEPDFQNLKNSLVCPFDIIERPLFRIRLFKTDCGGYLFCDFYHAISDGTSIKIFLEDICRAYRGECLEPDYYFVAEDERRKKENSALYSEAKEYYAQTYDWCDWSIYPAPDFDTEENEYGTTTALIPITAEVYRYIYEQYGVGKNIFFIVVSCLAIYMSEHDNNVMISWIYNGRDTLAELHTFGAMLEVFYVGICFGKEKTLRSIFQDVTEQVRKNIYYSCYYYSGPRNATGKGEVNLNFLQDLKSLAHDEKLIWTPVDMSETKKGADNLLDIEILEENNSCSMQIEYNACAYKKETIDKFKELFVKIAVSLAESNFKSNIRIDELLKGIE